VFKFLCILYDFVGIVIVYMHLNLLLSLCFTLSSFKQDILLLCVLDAHMYIGFINERLSHNAWNE